MRVRLKCPQKIFDTIKTKNNLNLKQLSTKLGINYSTLKKYRRGDLTIPEEVIKKLSLRFSTSIDYSNLSKLEDNWGQALGRRKKINALSKKELTKMMDYVRSFRKIRQVKLKINKFLCEFYGTLMGDGCISRFKDSEKNNRIQINISGNKGLDFQYLKYLKEMLKNEYEVHSYYYEYKNRNVCTLSIRNKSLALGLAKLEFPIGHKYKKLKIPNKFLVLGWDYKKLILRGLFDTDGSIYSRKDEGYKYPIISIKSKSNKLLNQILNLLRKENYPAYISGDNVAIRGKKNIIRWFNDIGSSNLRNKLKYEYWLRNKILPPKVIQTGLIVHQ